MNTERITEVVDETIEGMTAREKETVRTTPKDDLISLYHGWGRAIRNQYKMWQDMELVRATGKDHPDDASMVIIEAVWERLQAE